MEETQLDLDMRMSGLEASPGPPEQNQLQVVKQHDRSVRGMRFGSACSTALLSLARAATNPRLNWEVTLSMTARWLSHIANRGRLESWWSPMKIKIHVDIPCTKG